MNIICLFKVNKSHITINFTFSSLGSPKTVNFESKMSHGGGSQKSAENVAYFLNGPFYQFRCSIIETQKLLNGNDIKKQYGNSHNFLSKFLRFL